jgi:hypothetical protein
MFAKRWKRWGKLVILDARIMSAQRSKQFMHDLIRDCKKYFAS